MLHLSLTEAVSTVTHRRGIWYLGVTSHFSEAARNYWSTIRSYVKPGRRILMQINSTQSRGYCKPRVMAFLLPDARNQMLLRGSADVTASTTVHSG
jgi:hypothetical protein